MKNLILILLLMTSCSQDDYGNQLKSTTDELSDLMNPDRILTQDDLWFDDCVGSTPTIEFDGEEIVGAPRTPDECRDLCNENCLENRRTERAIDNGTFLLTDNRNNPSAPDCEGAFFDGVELSEEEHVICDEDLCSGRCNSLMTDEEREEERRDPSSPFEF